MDLYFDQTFAKEPLYLKNAQDSYYFPHINTANGWVTPLRVNYFRYGADGFKSWSSPSENLIDTSFVLNDSAIVSKVNEAMALVADTIFAVYSQTSYDSTASSPYSYSFGFLVNPSSILSNGGNYGIRDFDLSFTWYVSNASMYTYHATASNPTRQYRFNQTQELDLRAQTSLQAYFLDGTDKQYSFITDAFGGVSALLNIELLPNVSIGLIALFPLLLGVLCTIWKVGGKS